jgi:uncharacterized protein YjiS (DUF1127 family)
MTCASMATRHSVGSLGGRAADLASGFIGSLRAWRKRSLARRHLMDLDDRLLRDIGLTRSDVLHSSCSVHPPESWRYSR